MSSELHDIMILEQTEQRELDRLVEATKTTRHATYIEADEFITISTINERPIRVQARAVFEADLALAEFILAHPICTVSRIKIYEE